MTPINNRQMVKLCIFRRRYGRRAWRVGADDEHTVLDLAGRGLLSTVRQPPHGELTAAFTPGGELELMLWRNRPAGIARTLAEVDADPEAA